jgi:hypothetical protein
MAALATINLDCGAWPSDQIQIWQLHCWTFLFRNADAVHPIAPFGKCVLPV